MPSITLNSLDLGTSSGRPVLVLHGWGHNLGFLRPLGELISPHRPVHIIDLPGHGATPTPEEVWGMKEFAVSIKEFIDARGYNEVDLIGHSFGGKVCVKFSALNPGIVNKLVLINSSGIRPIRTLPKALRIHAIGILRWLVKTCDLWVHTDLFKKWFVPMFASPDYLNAGPLKNTFIKTLQEDLSEEMQSIQIPTLLLWGEKDTETPLAMGERFSQLLPDSTLVVLHGKDHTPFLGAGAHLCMKHIRAFLELDESPAQKEIG